MPNRKLTATTPYGKFTRKTARTYTHVIVGVGFTDTYLNQQRKDDRNRATQDLQWYKDVQAGKADRHNMTDEYISQRINDLTQHLDELEAKHDGRKADSDAAIATQSGVCLAWAGRYDLAVKAAATHSGVWAHIHICPVDAEA